MNFQKCGKAEGKINETCKDLVPYKGGAFVIAPVSIIMLPSFLSCEVNLWSHLFIFSLFLCLPNSNLMQCSHDGSCPLVKSGKYCHFVQRLQRTTSQRAYKVLPNYILHYLRARFMSQACYRSTLIYQKKDMEFIELVIEL